MEKTIPRLVKEVVLKYPDIPAQYFKNKKGEFESLSFKEMFSIAMDFAGGLLSMGTVRGEKIGLISDNRKEWEQADIGLLSIGAIDVPRGCDASANDLKYILSVTECRTVIAENPSQVKKILGIKAELPELKTIICFDELSEENKADAAACGVELFLFMDIVRKGSEYNAAEPGRVDEEIQKGGWDDLAGIIFTSGTTGTPKGVMLSHGNFITQLDELQERIYLRPGERALCVLPIWHVFQRECEYVIMSQAAALCYSKPIASVMLPDFQALNPHLMPAVPRVFEAISEGVDRTMRRTGGITLVLYKFFVNVAVLHSKIHRKLFRQNVRFRQDFLPLWWILLFIPWILLFPLKALGSVLVFSKIRAKLGTNFRAGIAGGGAYPSVIDNYFWALGVNIVEGYGLTETAPVVAVRFIDKPVFGCIGTPIRGVNVRVVDMEGNDVGRCKKGVLQVKGGTVMKGYYKRPDLTAKTISSDGWLDTGDLAMIGINGEIKILGRIKDTIVLRGGENIEPLPIETKLKESQYISMAVVVGQDQRNLGALILPDREELEAYAKENGITYSSYESLLENPEIYRMIEGIVKESISQKNGFRMFEKIPRFAFISKPFEVGKELSAKQDLMRFKISEIYEKEIKSIFRD